MHLETKRLSLGLAANSSRHVYFEQSGQPKRGVVEVLAGDRAINGAVFAMAGRQFISPRSAARRRAAIAATRADTAELAEECTTPTCITTNRGHRAIIVHWPQIGTLPPCTTMAYGKLRCEPKGTARPTYNSAVARGGFSRGWFWICLKIGRPGGAGATPVRINRAGSVEAGQEHPGRSNRGCPGERQAAREN